MSSRLRVGCLIVLVILALVVIFAGRPFVSNILADQMHSYKPLDNDPVIAWITVSTTQDPIKWNVKLLLQDSSGKPSDRSPSKPVNCELWALKADVISIIPLVATGVPAGWYVLTTLTGTHCYDANGHVDNSPTIFTIDRNTGPVTQDGAFWRLVSLNPLISNSIGPDGKTYEAVITQTSLELIATN